MSNEFNTGMCISSLIRHKPKTTVLAVALVLVGMMFLVPAITEKAMGEIHAQVPDYGKYQNYDDPKACCSSHLDAGQFGSSEGSCYPSCTPSVYYSYIQWTTISTGVFGGSETGYVKASIKGGSGTGIVTFTFSNPISGQNTCGISIAASNITTPLNPHCSITQGNVAEAGYCINGIPVTGGGKVYNDCARR
jgi:hypothetical protein